MWPEDEKSLTEKQRAELEKRFSSELNVFIKNEKLDAEFGRSFKNVYLPLAKWIEDKHSKDVNNNPVIIGINGAQGSGKSTLSKLLVKILEKLFNKNVLHLSIDDLYLSQAERLSLASTIHPLLKVRGVPGTHDVRLGIEILESVKQALNNKIKLPVFNKATDDLIEKDKWPILSNNIEIVLFEGWCVAAKPQLNEDLIQPVNVLEKNNDQKHVWRSYVNKQLSEKYAELFSYIDYLIMLKVPSMASIYEWRKCQELKLQESNKTKQNTMSTAELKEFMMYFERITRACLTEMPQRADVLLQINKTHHISKVSLR